MKVLEFFGEPLSYGGQETFIINMYSNFSDKNEYTFCTPFYLNNEQLKKIVGIKGDKLLFFDYKFKSKLRKLYIYKTAKKVCCNYDVIHIHSGSILTLLMVAIIAKKNKIKRVIVHSHATGYNTFSHWIIKNISDSIIKKYADIFLACSKEAGRFKFSNEIVNSTKFGIVKNGIDLEKYKFSETIRKCKRKELSIDNQTIICNIGRFAPEKNHLFLLDIFNEYLKLDENSKLLIIGGDGCAEQAVQDKINKLQFADKVILLKNRMDINELLNVVDVFIFPSLFEGLGISAIEAQAEGIPTICAKHLPKELNASECYYALSLSDNPKKWANMAYYLKNKRKKNQTEQLRKNGYDVRKCAEILEQIYEYGL